jgi:UDP-N-acetylmuramoylalanine--D-glutamate ligase
VIPVTTFKDRTVALFGLGGSGVATAHALQAGGARVLAWDDNADRVKEAAEHGIGTGDLREADWTGIAALVLSPGVPLTHPEPHWAARLAQGAGVEIIGDIELFCRERARIAPDSPFVAITGTNGKSTTTALVTHLLREAGWDVQMGGNIGTAILSLEPPAPGRVHVIECSSFQVDLAPFLAPSIGVLLNVSPDHLDRHGAMENYAAIKERLIARAALAVIGVDDDHSRAIARRRVGPVVQVSLEAVTPPGMLARGMLLEWIESDRRIIADLDRIGSLRGRHNAQNAAAAAAVALALGLSDEAIQSGMRSFPGLPHRMEEVGRRGATLFINDSKATNADSTEKALASFDNILWILGGKAKEGGITSLRPYFDKIRQAYLIGAATEEFATTLEGAVPFTRAGTLDRAVELASQDARGGEAVVLLSPACASYDQFPNFEVRGNRFRDLVRALPGIDTIQGGS